ncbi:CDP-glucose 4,6-dehydratase [compost metagenome]
MCEKWGTDGSYKFDINEHPHEANFLKLDCSKANMTLHWSPRWDIDKALDMIIDWTHEYKTDNDGDLSRVCLHQIKEYMTGVELIGG